VEDLASDVATFNFDNYPPEVGTPLAGDLAPRQEVSLNEEHPTEELPKHSVVVLCLCNQRLTSDG
jgi:hypothetical protein